MAARSIRSLATASVRTACRSSANSWKIVFSVRQDRVLREELIEYVIAGLQEEIRQRHSAFDSWLKSLREETQRIEVDLNSLVEVIATGIGSQSVLAAITERRAMLREITNPTEEPCYYS